LRVLNIYVTIKYMRIYRRVPSTIQFLVRLLTPTFFRLGAHLSFVGADALAEHKRSLIYASNHTSEWDPILMTCGLPMMRSNLPLYYVSLTKEYYPKKRFGWRSYLYGGIFFQMLGAYPVYKGLRNYALALRNQVKILQNGNSLHVFPEGKIIRSEADKDSHGGVAYLAHITNTPVVPVFIKGFGLEEDRDANGKRNVTITYGKPIMPEDLFDTDIPLIEDYKKAGQKIMKTIYAL